MQGSFIIHHSLSLNTQYTEQDQGFISWMNTFMFMVWSFDIIKVTIIKQNRFETLTTLQRITLFSQVKVKFICIAHFMYKTIQSALHKIKALQWGAEKALKM